MSFKTFANKAKDLALQRVARWFINHHRLNHLGKITALRFDSEAQEIFMMWDLHGEQTPLELTLHYRVRSPTLIEIIDVKASREWITALVNQVIPAEQKRLTVSTTVTQALSKLMK